MSVQADPALRPWRRYLRFSVRGLIVLILVIGAGLGWIVRRASIQRNAVATIERAGGGVDYTSLLTNERSLPGGKPLSRGIAHGFPGDRLRRQCQNCLAQRF